MSHECECPECVAARSVRNGPWGDDGGTPGLGVARARSLLAQQLKGMRSSADLTHVEDAGGRDMFVVQFEKWLLGTAALGACQEDEIALMAAAWFGADPTIALTARDYSHPPDAGVAES